MLKRLALDRTDNLLIQFGRYTVVGGVAFIADFGCLFALTEFLHIYYLVSAALAFLLGLSVNYLLSISWVFNRRVVTSKSYEMLLFALIGVVGLGLNELCMWLLTEHAGLYYLASKIGSTVLVYLWNFLARRYMLFSQDAPMAKETAIIIGAGPAGLTAAEELIEKTDITPIVYEQTGDIGRISKTVNYTRATGWTSADIGSSPSPTA